MNYKGLIKGSRTLDYATILVIFGAIQAGLPFIQNRLAGWYGPIFIVVGIITGLLRLKTTKPVGQ